MASDITLYDSTGNPVIVTGDEMSEMIDPNHGIESGSNANGSWTKFPDGTAICTVTKSFDNIDVDSVWGGIVESEQTLDLGAIPITLVRLDSATSSVNTTSSGLMIQSVNGANTTHFGIYKVTRGNARTGLTFEIHVQAIGRWK